MPQYSPYQTFFDTFDLTAWQVSDYVNPSSWIDTAWVPENVIIQPGTVALQLDDTDAGGKGHSGAEIRSEDMYFYGTYEVVMQAAPGDGSLSSFFLYTGAPFDDFTSEIDFEFLGGDTSDVLLTYHTPDGVDAELISLGYDAAAAEHTYTIEWGPDSISWYADGVLLREVTESDIGLPSEPTYVFMSIWTGSNLFTGTPAPGSVTSATYSSFSYQPIETPVAIDDRADVLSGGTAVVDVLANDDVMSHIPDLSSVTVVTAPQFGSTSVDPVTGQITYIGNAGYVGLDTFSYSYSDGTGTSNAGDVQIVSGMPVYETFSMGAGGFVYVDDLFRGTAEPGFADGTAPGGVIEVSLGGGSTKSTITDISGGWTQDFEAQAGQVGTVTLRYRLELTAELDGGEFAEVLIGLDGAETSLVTIAATDSNNEVLDSGWVEVTLDLGVLSGGTHTLDLGGYLNQRTRGNESATISFDSVQLALSSPNPADDDATPLALAAPDLLIDGLEAASVTLSVTGLDADATGRVTVSDGVTNVTATIAADGDVVLDLTGLADGPLSTEVTATETGGGGASVTVAGPGLDLVPAGADDDANMALTAPDLLLSGDERLAVTLSLSGLDADATAVITVSDGVADVTGALSADGDIVLDLTPLADGPATTSVTATDTNGAQTTLPGPGLTLDSAPPPPNLTPIDTGFDSDAGGFVYVDDLFRGTAEPGFADGTAPGGVIEVSLGGGSTKSTITDISGGWTQDFEAQAGQVGTVTLRYRLELTAELDGGEFAEVLIGLDGAETSLVTIAATDSNNEVLDSGWVEVTLDLGVLSGGTHTLDLGGYLNQRTRGNESATISFDSVQLALSSPNPADDDATPLALAAPDLLIDGLEAASVTLSVTGLDADATGRVTVSDGVTNVTATIAADGDVVLDLTGLADGPLSTEVTATETGGGGASVTVAGPGLDLVPAGADDDANMALTAPDLLLSGDERLAVTLSLSGLDADATAVITVSDGVADVTGALSADGDIVLDLTPLADGPATTSVTATDTNGAQTTLPGPGLTLDSAPPPPNLTPIDTGFDSDAGGFVYVDDLFRGTAEPGFADGTAPGGVIEVSLGGGSTKSTITDISGGWTQDFEAQAGQVGTVTLRYRLELTAELDGGEFAEVLIGLDGAETSLVTIAATDSNNEVLDSGWVEVTLDLGVLSGGTHTLDLGGYLNQRTRGNESATISFDSVQLALSSPNPADDDATPLALAAPDLLIDGLEAASVTLSVTGLDADATGRVTVSDGVTNVTATIAADGDVVLDLTGLADGPLSTEVTATETGGGGASVTVAGPGLDLVPAGADDDANMALTAPDLLLSGDERLAVTLSLSGLDADATAVITVSDGVADVTGALSADGDLVLDLTPLADGPVTTSVTATDTNGAQTTLPGPGLTLDSAPPPPNLTPIDTGFDSDAGGFVYVDDLFRGTAEPGFADGTAPGGVIEVSLGGGSTKSTITDISGGWTQDFEAQAGQVGTVTLRYRLELTAELDGGEFAEVLIGLDGAETSLVTIAATDSNNEVLDSGWVEVTLDLGVLSGGTHTLDLGGYLNQRTRGNESATISFDSVQLALSSPNPADDDATPLALAAPDLLIDGLEAASVTLSVTGLDADATGRVTVSDGVTNVTATIAADGDVVLDLTGLADGPLSTEVTATETGGGGASVTVAGPGLDLVPAGADDDANMALTAPDLLLSGDERLAVTLSLSGLDADATAVITVSDGVADVTGALSADGDLVLDLTPLADGPVTTSVTATDTNGAQTTLPGPDMVINGDPIAIDFSAESHALSVDLDSSTYGYAARVLTIGDSLTLGFLGDTDPVTLAERPLQEGYRGDLNEGLLSQGVYIDFVGRYSNGPALMSDTEHSGDPGIQMWQIVNNDVIVDDVTAYDAEIVILMAGTNDVNVGGTGFFSSKFPTAISALQSAIDEFYAMAGSTDRHFVVSTIPPKIGAELESEILNEGYSIVGGVEVVGDAGNGTYVPGIKATVTANQASHPSLHLYDAVFDSSLLGPDGVHYQDAGYSIYASGLEALLISEIGISGGTLDGTSQALGAGAEVEGGSGGDFIAGSEAANLLIGGDGGDLLQGRGGDDTLFGEAGIDRLEGGGGADVLIGGTEADAFVFATDFANGTSAADEVVDFGLGDDRLIFDASFEGQITVNDIVDGVQLSVAGTGTIDVKGPSEHLLKGTDLGGGVYELTTDTTLVAYLDDAPFIS